MLIKLHDANPNKRDVEKIINVLNNDGLIIYPTDTGYALGCSINSKKALDRLLLIKQPEKLNYMSFICHSLKNISEYAEVSNNSYKILKKHLPGPYTFILKATKLVSKHISSSKKTVGIRIPDNSIILHLVSELGHPISSTSINHSHEEPLSDPTEIHEKYRRLVDIVIDGGEIFPDFSTVVDISDDEIEIIREGKGSIEWLVGDTNEE